MGNFHFALAPDDIIRRICIDHNGFSINSKCLCRNSVVSSTQVSNCVSLSSDFSDDFWVIKDMHCHREENNFFIFSSVRKN